MNKFNTLKKISLALTLLASAISIASCGNRFKLKNRGVETFENIPSISFQEILDEVITNNCLECHSTYSNYEVVAGQSQSILSAVLSGRMPKNKSPLSSELQTLLTKWVNDGAPELPGVESKETPLEATYDSLMIRVFAPKCLNCHSGSPDAPGPTTINFSTYSDLIKSNNLYAERFGVGFLDVESPEDSELIFLVEEGAEEPMPPLTLPGNPDYVPPEKITPEELDVIIDWIKKGIPKN